MKMIPLLAVLLSPTFAAASPWSALVQESMSKNATINVWGMDRDETRHDIHILFVKAEGKVYLSDDEDRERDATHTVWVTDVAGEKLYFGVSYYHPYGNGMSTKVEMTGKDSIFREYKALAERFAGTARPDGSRGDCQGRIPAALHITWKPKGIRFVYAGCSQFNAPREMTHPSPMTDFDGWIYKAAGYELILSAESGYDFGRYEASVLNLNKDGSVRSSEELGFVSNADLESGAVIPVPEGTLSSF